MCALITLLYMHMMFFDSFCKMFCDSANQKFKDVFFSDYTAMAWHKAGECNNKGNAV
jgi:hypothetical protein